MQKVKIDFSKFGLFIKVALTGIIATLVGVLVFSVVLKFVDLSSLTICYINDIIKVLSIFIMILILKKSGEDKLMFKSVFVGILYAILCFAVFSVLNGSFQIGMSTIYDLVFAVVVAIIATTIVNILKRKSM